ncbi:MAG: hypothetical protein M1820_006149 [Bogoriella megaspora]|nr:MAG: hypothetical protein M1820_006149 [Bogoriella megaspora]
MGFSSRLRSYFEHRRLEQRYLNRSKRSTFTVNAQYIDGEYIYADNPTSPTTLFHPPPPQPQPRPIYFSSQSEPVIPRQARFDNEFESSRRTGLGAGDVETRETSWESGRSERQKVRRMSSVVEATRRGSGESDGVGELPPRPKAGWKGGLARRRSMLGRVG